MNFLTSHSVKIQIVLDIVEADLSDGEVWETIITKSTTSTVFVVFEQQKEKSKGIKRAARPVFNYSNLGDYSSTCSQLCFYANLGDWHSSACSQPCFYSNLGLSK